ncbi:MAG TPA: DUF3826 domain-containing protein [Caulifigura sp.]|nr:DUF3826 domain-containing protein [Caulifigura sp.]
MRFLLVCLVLLAVQSSVVAVAEEVAAADAEYVRVTSERARKIVAKLDISDAACSARVQDVIARQYRDLSTIHSKRDAALAAAAPKEKSEAEASKAAAQRDAEAEQFRLHYAFLARLAVELTPAQIEQVKDGVTMNVVPVTFKRYQQLLPDLPADQLRHIQALLLEAREHAMDAGSSEAKHAIFGKYKGRINNYLSAAGVDMKAAERALQERERAAKAAS